MNHIHIGPLYFHFIPKLDKNIILPLGLESDNKWIQTTLSLDHFYSAWIKKTAQPPCRAALAHVVLYVQNLMFQHCSSKADELLNIP